MSRRLKCGCTCCIH
ncbi:uncharacterized protein FPRN_10334 [Fusarium proliferatum]|nr:uncharacterized protein FPRN_10334 [Fusarium proliferatum]